MIRNANSLIQRFRHDRRGAVAAIVALSIFGLLGMGALGVDVANVYLAQHIVQASAEAAALAGATQIGNGGDPITTAEAYSSTDGGANTVNSELPITMNAGYPKLSYASGWANNPSGAAGSVNYGTPSCAAPCNNPSTGVNLITVAETAKVPTFFGRIFGIKSVSVSGTATASWAGTPLPYNVALVLDTTASMGGTLQGAAAQKACSGYNSAIACAADGAQILLGTLWPCASGFTSCTGQAAVDEVSLFVFPPVTNAGQATTDIGCTDPTISTYYSGVANTMSAANTSSSTLALATAMTAKTEYNTGMQWAVATDAGQPTTAITRSGDTLTFASGNIPTTVKGLTVQDSTNLTAIAAGTTVSNVAGGTVTLSKSVAAAVDSGDLITFGTSIPAGTGNWPWWDTGTYISSVTLPTTAVMSAKPTGAGLLKGDTILASPLYQIVPFANDYRASDTSALNASSNIVKITGNTRGTPCLGTPGGLGTYYADAISAAQSALAAEQAARKAAGQTAGQNVIVFLSDGNGSSSATQMGPFKTTTGECQAAVTAAQNAAKAGTTVYTIYYDDNGTSSTCQYDSGSYTGGAPKGACYTLQQMAVAPGSSSGTYASDIPKQFYSIDGTGGPCAASFSYTSIASIFQHIAYQLTAPRLVPVGTS